MIPWACLWNVTTICLTIQRLSPVAIPDPPGHVGKWKKENHNRRFSSLKFPNTISLILFQFMRFDKEIKVLLQAIPISQCKYSLKIATSRKAFISMSLLKKNVKIWEGCRRNLIKTFMCRKKESSSYPSIGKMIVYLVHITHQNCHKKLDDLYLSKLFAKV